MDWNNRFLSNAKGKYYVDQSCIDCNLCLETAPENFTRDVAGGFFYVKKQPDNQAEEKLCADAKSACPVDAIGDDGDNKSM